MQKFQKKILNCCCFVLKLNILKWEYKQKMFKKNLNLAKALNLFLPSGLNWNERKIEIEIVSKFNLSGVNYPTFQGQVGLVWAQNRQRNLIL